MSIGYAINRAALQGADLGPRNSLGKRDTIQAPVGGWNTADAWASMKPKYAIQIDNYFPESGAVVLRRGSRVSATGAGTDYVQTLIPHQSGTVSKLYAVGGGQIWNVTNPSQVSTLAAESVKDGSYASDRWRFAHFAGSTIMVNGEDPPERIQPDGTMAADHNWTKASGQDGLPFSASDLSQVLPFKGRLFFLQKDTANLWYGDLGAIQGDLTRFALDRVNADGGNAIGLGTITIDSGEGVDDLLCIFFDNGSVLVYQGTDITSSSDWDLVGLWKIGRLIGDKALTKFGGDLVAMTTDGYIPVTRLLQTGRVAHSSEIANLSSKIANTVTEKAALHGDTVGWDCVLHTNSNWLLFNVPAFGGEQHVMNTQTGAWCRFVGMDARCWAQWKDRLFFGGPGGSVLEANVGTNDNGNPIEGDVRGAFQYLGTAMDKRFTLARALIDSDADVTFTIGTVTDFNEEGGLEAPSSLRTGGAEWDEAEWGDDDDPGSDWAGGTFSLQEWQALNRDGTAISVRLRSSTSGARMRYFATDIISETTHALL